MLSILKEGNNIGNTEKKRPRTKPRKETSFITNKGAERIPAKLKQIKRPMCLPTLAEVVQTK